MPKKSDKNKGYQLPKGFAPGVKRTRGKPILYESVKVKLNLTLTELAVELLRKAADSKGVSKSELIEQWARTTLNPDQV